MNALLTGVAAVVLPLSGLMGQVTPRFAPLTASRVLLMPLQDVTGAVDAPEWRARFDSSLTATLRDGGVGSAWGYASDAARYHRQNPSYLTEPSAVGARSLAGDGVRDGTPVPDPLASRLRAFVAVADAQLVIVPVAGQVDSAGARVRIVVIDARSARVIGVDTVTVREPGTGPAVASALAQSVARLFITPIP